MMLTPKKKEYFRRLLNKKAEEFFERIKISVTTFTGSDVDINSESFNFTDQATLESLMDLNIHIKERDGRLIVKIKDALECLRDGTYGICEECGEEISELRLKARLETTMCIQCKKTQEAKEKQRGF